MILYPDWTWDTIPDEYIEDVLYATEHCAPHACDSCPLNCGKDDSHEFICLCWLPRKDELDKLIKRFENTQMSNDNDDSAGEKLIAMLTGEK